MTQTSMKPTLAQKYEVMWNQNSKFDLNLHYIYILFNHFRNNRL